jgi:multiple antibiotic resistance protein
VVFPLAIPLVAGPGAISAAIILAARAQGEMAGMTIVLGALLAVMGVAAVFALLAQESPRHGRYRPNVVLRLFGILFAAVAMQFVFDGLAASGLLAAGK